jgi:glycerophosphoryl diester phosphodiesterase
MSVLPTLPGPAPASAALPAARPARPSGTPLVIAHRGASGYRPEHTLASYRLAVRLGADYVEPDLVSTADGVLVARHENEISGTTDVADHPEFADRCTTRTVDGRRVTGWFTEDFTLAELKTLRAKERLPALRAGNTRYDGMFEVPTFAEVLDLVEEESRRRGEVVGVYPETKHPSHFASIGLCLSAPLVAALEERHLNRPNAAVHVQSFETANLRDLRDHLRVPLVQLVAREGAPYDLASRGDVRGGTDLLTPDGLAEAAEYADAVGLDKALVLPRDDGAPASVTPTGTDGPVSAAHDAGLAVHVWTLRDENAFLARAHRRGTDPGAVGDALAEYRALFDVGVDGVFSDFPDTAVAARGHGNTLRPGARGLRAAARS